MKIHEIINKYEDLLSDAKTQSLIQVIENNKIIIENCKRIINYNENEIEFELIKCNISIIGLNLKMKSYNRTGVIINGKIHSIKLIEK